MVARRSLERALKYRFQRPELLREALTHSTWANEHPGSGKDNQRLEFLGDAVLGLLASRLLFEQLVEGDEGELSRRRARVVRRESLAALARELDLATLLQVGEGQKRDGVDTDSTLSDAYEALAGAVFVDGGFEAVERCFGPRIAAAIAGTTGASDPKTALQEACHARGLPPPLYEVVTVRGPDHDRVYTCEVRVGEHVLGRGEGSSKKIAEQQCATKALRKLESR